MFIKQLSQVTGVTAKTIRYYESIGLMPPPERADNNYRVYTPDAIDRLRFIAAARALDFTLADIAEFLDAQDKNQLACHRVLVSLEQQILEIDRRIADLLTLRETLKGIRGKAQDLPLDSKCNQQCVCYLLTVNRDNGQITTQNENLKEIR